MKTAFNTSPRECRLNTWVAASSSRARAADLSPPDPQGFALNPAGSDLRPALREVFAALRTRDEAAGDVAGATPTPRQIARMGAVLGLRGRRLVSVATASEPLGLTVGALLQRARACRIPHARELGMVFVDVDRVRAAITGDDARHYAPQRLPRRAPVSFDALLQLAGELMAERHAERSERGA